ncbi:MAG TPA: HNH endonuclease [Candidatus Jeotgalibaca merdavium]|uniref:HNH endonuclease n=1 Tax=Candidatus Jeotgalibaca merdavium TaxID=2838627 RepID=A0A9D2KXM2_9LACT|nr:HNH endonuclease [Candidatus Jeotgalibaca merdavium]
MEVEYKDGYAYADNYKFRKDTNTGYYLSTRKIGVSRLRLHVYVWEKHNGDIPKGYEIHHKDENKNNNEIENLACLSKKEHLRWHGEHISDELKDKWIANLNDNARPKASEWHRSPEGRKWHREHAKKTLTKENLVYVEKKCELCGKTYETAREWSKYCSPNCVTKARKKSGVDNEERKCAVCGSSFIRNKYSKTKTCSKKCAGKLISKTKKS